MLIPISCKNIKNNNNSSGFTEIKNKYAQLFKIEKNKTITKLSVFDKNNRLINNYYLIDKLKEIPDSLKNENIIKTPVKKIICLSTTHIAFFDALNNVNKIYAVSGTNYVYNQNLKKRIESGEVVDIGYENSLDFEKILKLKPDLLTAYDINGNISPIINKLKKYNIPVVIINEFSEPSILGQTEWLKFIAQFLNNEKESDTLFNMIEKNYISLKQKSYSIKHRPTVLLNMPWKGTWYVPGGKSNIAQLINDAGGNYLWKNSSETHNYPLSTEEVYTKALNVDFWLNPGQARTINEIVSIDERLKDFRPVTTKQIYNRNKRLSPGGGNDFMESGIIRPDIILKDLIKILHPEILDNDSLFYYQKLN